MFGGGKVITTHKILVDDVGRILECVGVVLLVWPFYRPGTAPFSLSLDTIVFEGSIVHVISVLK